MNNHTPYCIACGMGCDFMNEYEILMDNNVVGEATVWQQGLYTHFRCACDIKSDAFIHIIASYDDKDVDLGICIVENDRFTRETKIPTKHLGSGKPRFIATNDNKCVDEFIPLSQNDNLLMLNKIKTARFTVKNGVAGLYFTPRNLQEDCPNR